MNSTEKNVCITRHSKTRESFSLLWWMKTTFIVSKQYGGYQKWGLLNMNLTQITQNTIFLFLNIDVLVTGSFTKVLLKLFKKRTIIVR